MLYRNEVCLDTIHTKQALTEWNDEIHAPYDGDHEVSCETTYITVREEGGEGREVRVKEAYITVLFERNEFHLHLSILLRLVYNGSNLPDGQAGKSIFSSTLF